MATLCGQVLKERNAIHKESTQNAINCAELRTTVLNTQSDCDTLREELLELGEKSH